MNIVSTEIHLQTLYNPNWSKQLLDFIICAINIPTRKFNFILFLFEKEHRCVRKYRVLSTFLIMLLLGPFGLIIYDKYNYYYYLLLCLHLANKPSFMPVSLKTSDKSLRLGFLLTLSCIRTTKLFSRHRVCKKISC